jgi:hypothetical protein
MKHCQSHLWCLPACATLQAFVKLESLPSLPAEQREALADLAAAIFLQHPPVDARSIRETREKRSGSTGGGMDAVLEGLGSDQDQVGCWQGLAGDWWQGLAGDWWQDNGAAAAGAAGTGQMRPDEASPAVSCSCCWPLTGGLARCIQYACVRSCL